MSTEGDGSCTASLASDERRNKPPRGSCREPGTRKNPNDERKHNMRVATSVSPELGVGCSAYLTAWNPGSEPTAQAMNQAAQARLEADLEAAGYPILRGMGVDPAGSWPGEPSVLVLGISRTEAHRLGGCVRPECNRRGRTGCGREDGDSGVLTCGG